MLVTFVYPLASMTRAPFFALIILCSLLTVSTVAQDVDEITVTARRLTDSLSQTAYSVSTIDGAALQGPAFGVDDVLRRVPGFGLFRRQTSRASHPTTQGVSLRGLGPNGAGRTLVLLDGVPLNDPFGGWVEWVHLPALTIEQATVVRGGGAGPWGNAALAGVVRLDSRAGAESGLVADVRAGSRDSYTGAAAFSAALDEGALSGSIHASDSDGYFGIGPNQRGAADRTLARNSEGVRLNWASRLSNGVAFTLTGGWASDSFVNGSEVAGSETDTYDLSLTAVQDTTGSDVSWQTALYYRHKEFSTVFGAFDGTRDTVRPVLNQFDVPATAIGGNAVVRWTGVDNWTIETGADVRMTDGETNEQFRNLGAGFTRERAAGGEQMIAGTFVEGHWQASPGVLLTVGTRIDHWRQTDGMRQERDLADNAVRVDRAFENRSGWVANGRAALQAGLTDTLSSRAAIYTGFRVPTLNELYRPFRVGNDITEANAALKNERLIGAEVALDWQSDEASVSGVIFRNDLFDPVANTTITTTPGFNAEFGVFIPGGGSLRQRRNLDRVETWGVELDTRWQPLASVHIRASYLFTDPTVKKSAVAPDLVGNRLAQVARHQGTVGLDVSPNGRLRATVDIIAASKQYEDDQNLRLLDSAITVDAQIAYKLTDHVEIYVAAENLFDARIEAGRSGAGLVTLGAPVFLWTGLRVAY